VTPAELHSFVVPAQGHEIFPAKCHPPANFRVTVPDEDPVVWMAKGDTKPVNVSHGKKVIGMKSAEQIARRQDMRDVLGVTEIKVRRGSLVVVNQPPTSKMTAHELRHPPRKIIGAVVIEKDELNIPESPRIVQRLRKCLLDVVPSALASDTKRDLHFSLATRHFRQSTFFEVLFTAGFQTPQRETKIPLWTRAAWMILPPILALNRRCIYFLNP